MEESLGEPGRQRLGNRLGGGWGGSPWETETGGEDGPGGRRVGLGRGRKAALRKGRQAVGAGVPGQKGWGRSEKASSLQRRRGGGAGARRS